MCRTAVAGGQLRAFIDSLAVRHVDLGHFGAGGIFALGEAAEIHVVVDDVSGGIQVGLGPDDDIAAVGSHADRGVVLRGAGGSGRVYAAAERGARHGAQRGG